MKLFGTWLPLVGWYEVDREIVDEMSEYHDIDGTRRYSAFHFIWFDVGIICDFRDKGPYEHQAEV